MSRQHSRAQSFVVVGGGTGSGSGESSSSGAVQMTAQGAGSAVAKSPSMPLLRVSVPQSAAEAAQLDAAYLDMVLDLKVLMPGGGETEDAEAP